MLQKKTTFQKQESVSGDVANDTVWREPSTFNDFPTTVPLEFTSFVGRERELLDLEQLLSQARLVTLTGTGGSGKTRLAMQSAKKAFPQFADGIWWIDLTPLRDPTLLPQLVAQTLGVYPVATQPLLLSLLQFVRSKQMLLILDNCEHLLSACASFIQQLLSYAPHLKILATSREVMGIAGEMTYQVVGLAWPAEGTQKYTSGVTEPHPYLQFAAVRLFVERAQTSSPQFMLTSDNVLAIVEICRRLDGMPLALELASARINVLTVQQITAHLDHRFTLLTTARRPSIQHHQTLRTAIDWSYDLLTDSEKTFLNRLSIFEGGCTLESADTICIDRDSTDGATLDIVSSLVNKSLVVAETLGRTHARYRLLESIRAYALDKLTSSGDLVRIRQHHLDFFLVQAEAIAPKLHEGEQPLWLDWLEGEHDNFRAALAWALESGSVEIGLRLANALYRFWEIRGYVQEGLVWFERLLAQTDASISPVVRTNALTFAAFLAQFAGNPTTTMRYGQQAVTLAESLDDKNDPILIFALAGLASGTRMMGNNETTFDIQSRMIQLLRTTPGPPFVLGTTVMVQGLVAIDLGRYAIAEPLLQESLTLAQGARDGFRHAYSLNAFGDLLYCQQQYGEAQAYYERGAKLLRSLGAAPDLAIALQSLGYTCLHLGDTERTYELFRESFTIHQTQQNMAAMGDCIMGFGAIAVVRGLVEAGVRVLVAGHTHSGLSIKASRVVREMTYTHFLTLARTLLTDTRFQREESIGHSLSLEETVAYALELPLSHDATPALTLPTFDLTRREWEVMLLIAQGKSNGDMANELVLSKRTVEKHVAHILSKLSLTTRSQVVRWVLDHPTAPPFSS